LFTDRRIAMLMMAAFAVMWAVLEEELGARLRRPYDLTQIVWCRYASHLLIVGMIWGWRTPSAVWRTSRPGRQLGRSLLMLVMPLSFGAAVAQGDAASNAWAMFWCAPLLILVIARAMLAERAPMSLWVTTALASIGAVFVIAPTTLPTGLGLLWPLLMAGSFALYVVLTRTLRHEALAANLFYTAIGVILPLSLYVPRIWVTPSVHDAVILFGIGALGFVSLLLLDRAVERTDVSPSAAFLSLQVASTLLIAVLRQHRAVTGTVLIGLILIVGMLALAWRSDAPTRIRQ
jgi:drug/metabolite transporter (DMT)-like permease